MTRINVISVKELSNQWLLAEYRELPRCIKQNISIKNAPKVYCLGNGHMKWARCHIMFLLLRYKEICEEMLYRNFKINYSYQDLLNWAYTNIDNNLFCEYIPTKDDINLNQQRLIEKYNIKPEFYKWTKRNKPSWLHM